jgi:hypothetical protein
MNNFYFNYSASLRIHNSPEIYEELSSIWQPTHMHKKGNINEKNNKKWENSAWILKSPVGEEKSLNEHLEWLWNKIKPHADYLCMLRSKNVHMDIFCGFRTDCDNAGFEIEPRVYEMLTKLNIPIGFSIILT